MKKKITSDEGILLRVNRSIQAEGTFAFAKEDMDFRRFLTRGKKKVEAEWLLLSLVLTFSSSILKSTKVACEQPFESSGAFSQRIISF